MGNTLWVKRLSQLRRVIFEGRDGAALDQLTTKITMKRRRRAEKVPAFIAP